MKKNYSAKLSGAALLCLLSGAFLAPQAEAGNLMGKLGRCRARIEASSSRALDCFSEVMVDGDRQERRIASYFLGLIAEDAPGNIPSVAEASRYIRQRDRAARENLVKTAPTAVIYHGAPRPPPEDTLATYLWEQARKEEAEANSRPRAVRRPAAVRTVKPGKFQVEEVTANFSARVNSAQTARRPGAGVPHAGGVIEVQERSGTLEKEAAEAEPAGIMEVSSVSVQEMARTPDLTIVEPDANEVPENMPPVVSDSVGKEEPSKVALVKFHASTAAFTIEDDIAPEPELLNEEVREIVFGTNVVEIGDAQLGVIEQAVKLLKNDSAKMTVRGLASPGERNPGNLSKIRAKIVGHLLEKRFHVPAGTVTVEWGVGVNQEDQRVLIIVKAS